MNIKRGLFRLWLLASVLWVAFWIYGTYEEYTNWPQQFARKVPLEHAAWLLIPPAVLFLLGYSLLWVFEGFRRNG